MSTPDPSSSDLKPGPKDDAGRAVRLSGTPQPFIEAPYDPTKDRELARGYLAKLLVWILGVSIIATFTLAGGGWVSVKDSLPVLTALIGVVGTALGFYFGGRDSRS